MPTAEQVTRARLEEFRDVARSGVTELTGRARREEGGGAFVGRIGGIKPMYPELNRIKDSPAAIASAVDRGKGPVYERAYSVVYDEMLRAGFKPGRKSYGRPTVEAHEGKKYCVRCRELHTKGQHRFHGEGSFHRTHLFSFKANPVPKGFRPPDSFTRFLKERHYLPAAMRPDLIAGLYQDAKLRAEYMEWVRGKNLITPESEGQRGLFNPRFKLVRVYGHVLRVEAQKTGPHRHCDAACKRASHNYIHDFRRGAVMYGLSPGMVFRVPSGKWPLLIMK